MIDDIIDMKVDWIESDLIKRGMNYDKLREDVLDHICCLVEESMNQGLDFDSSYSEVVDNIGNSRLQEIEHQTLLLLDIKFQKMKKTTYIIGLISAIIVLFGSLSKTMHWPGAGIALSLGLLATVFVFLPLYFVVTYREQSEKKSIIYPIIGYLTIALLLTGAIFKIQHWPGANFVLRGGMAVLIIGFVPLYLVNAFQKAKGEKVGLPYIVMLLVGIGITTLTFNVKMAKDVLEDYRTGAIQNEQRISDVMRQNDNLISLTEDSLSGQGYDQVMMIHQKASGLQTMIDDMLEEMLVAVKEPGIGLEDLQKIDKTGVGREVIVDNGWARRFINDSRDYLSMLSEMIDDPVSLAQIEDHLEYTSDVWYNEWGYKEVIYDPVIKIYFKHTDVAKGIALSEYVVLDYLLNLK
jgi:hypothetical protein